MDKSDIKILLVDDEPDIIEIVSYNLKGEGYQIFTATNGLEAITSAKKNSPHLILLDIMMPKMDGIEACIELRKDNTLNSTLIAFLTARAEDYSHVAGLDSGADDYITKPIKPRLLLSKIKALLRRSTVNQIIKNDKVSLEINRDKYIVICEGKEFTLPKKEFELLALLFSKPGNVFTREAILAKVWGDDIVVGDRTIDVHIRKLREKIGVMFGNPETTTGGNALKFYASVRIDIRRSSAIKNADKIIGNRTRVKVVKNKVAPPFQQAEFDIMYGEGISKTGEIIDLGVEMDIINKSGSWYSYGDTKLGQGRDAVKEILLDNPELSEELENKITDQLNS